MFTGALNHQTTHHMFPGISQYYYPEVTPILVAACKEYGVSYQYKPTFLQVRLLIRSLGISCRHASCMKRPFAVSNCPNFLHDHTLVSRVYVRVTPAGPCRLLVHTRVCSWSG